MQEEQIQHILNELPLQRKDHHLLQTPILQVMFRFLPQGYTDCRNLQANHHLEAEKIVGLGLNNPQKLDPHPKGQDMQMGWKIQVPDDNHEKGQQVMDMDMDEGMQMEGDKEYQNQEQLVSGDWVELQAAQVLKQVLM